MNARQLGLWRILVSSLLAGTWAGIAQSRDNPGGAAFKISVDRKSATYVLGERIPLKLTFSLNNSGPNNQYQINPAQYSRRDTTSFESYVVTPSEGSEDPLVNLDELGFVDSESILVLPNSPLTSPVTLPEDLNEYIRFTRPGRYTIRVRSNRLSAVDPVTGDGKNIEVSSDTLNIEISPRTERWAAAQIAAFDQILWGNSPYETKCNAVKDLTYMDTRESVPEMVKWFALDDSCHATLNEALLDSSFPEFVTQELARLLEDPSSSVPSDTVGLLAVRTLATEYKDNLLSKFSPGTESMDKAREELDARLEQLASLYVNTLKESLSRRSGSSLATALAALEFSTQSVQ